MRNRNSNIADVDWNHFSAKFSGDKEGAFQRLCYLLFCKEHNKSTGMSRFENHAGIETDPVDYNGRVVGWQAKFYSTKQLADHEADFIGSIDTTKKNHPSVDKVIFYVNRDFGQHPKGTDPAYKTRIEHHANAKGIEIVWRTASYFESPFVCEENFSIAQHFFSLHKGIIDSIKALSAHTDALLKPIRSHIAFGTSRIKLDRSPVLTALGNALRTSPLLILSGSAGVGKTAVIKELFKTVRGKVPLFVLKATQFNNISTAGGLLRDFGELTVGEFVAEHSDFDTKYVVVDSAEKLSDVENQDAFQILLSSLLDGDWNVIFTVRYSYLDDLKYQLEEIYGVSPRSLDIPGLSSEELDDLATDYDFELPTDERVRELLQIPVYLREWLQYYNEMGVDITYSDFRDVIWRKQIQNSRYQKSNIHVRRENCLLQIARERAERGSFTVGAGEFDQEALVRLSGDGIIERDPGTGGYFITHDIYEEWAMAKLLERSFIDAQDYRRFYQQIGSSLPVRRAFRDWLSDKLHAHDEAAKRLIEFTVGEANTDRHWKDDVLVAVLLSDYSSVFFAHFEQELLKAPAKAGSGDDSSETDRTLITTDESDNSLLYRILFLLRIACKTIDEDYLRQLGVRRTVGVAFKSIFTIPRGKGWESAIAFLNKHRTTLKLRYLNAVLPVLDDWNINNRAGTTTRCAAQMALFYYSELTSQDGFYFRSGNGTKDKLLRTIFNGSAEIKEELRSVFQNVLVNVDTSHRGPYYELVKATLGPLFDSAEVVKNLPNEVMQLANLFWFYSPEDTSNWHPRHSIDMEQYFDLDENHLEYYPSSAYQTPAFQLLRTAPQDAVDFILALVNRAVEYFSKTEFAKYEVNEVEVFTDGPEAPAIRQLNSYRIWTMYRGGQPAPNLLQSVHMALEKWLLAVVAKSATPEVLELWCLYLIRNSRSVSITAVVASVVLAEPSKLFNVAKVLFRTKEFFFLDTARMLFDSDQAKSIYAMAHDPDGIFKRERLETCEDKHRLHTLERQALSYQIFAGEGEEEDEYKRRQKVIWQILDDHYAQLPARSDETEEDKKWRMYLARMDRRKMSVSTEEKEDQVLFHFDPVIEPDLKQHREDALAKSGDTMKYTPLLVWARYRFEYNEDEYKKYPQYEDDYKLVITDSKAVFERLQTEEGESTFAFLCRSILPCACAVLVRDFAEQLEEEDMEFCKNIVFEHASLPLSPGYQYQFKDGVDAAINALPLLLRSCPEDSEPIKELLLFTLFDTHPVGAGQHLSDYAVSAILQHMWRRGPEDAHSVFLGYLLLKPRLDELCESIREENFRRREYGFSNLDALERLKSEYRSEISKVVLNQISFDDLPSVDGLEPATLIMAFLLLPLGTTDESHKRFIREMSLRVLVSMKATNREERLNPVLEHRFLEKLACFILKSRREEIESYLKPIIDNLWYMRDEAKMFNSFVIAEDRLSRYEEFWTVWRLFYPKVVEFCKTGHSLRYITSVVSSFLLASQSWSEDAREWHSIRERELAFFEEVAVDIGGHPAVLYSLSRLLNGIGKSFADSGIFWICDALDRHSDLAQAELEVNTVYYLENLVRGYILRHRNAVRNSLRTKRRILVLLDFLVDKGSAPAYLLREDIL